MLTLLYLFFDEAEELEREGFGEDKEDWGRIYAEAGDVIAFASAIATLAKERMEGGSNEE